MTTVVVPAALLAMGSPTRTLSSPLLVWDDDFNRVVESGLGPNYIGYPGWHTPEASVNGSAMVLAAGDESVGYVGFNGAGSRYGTIQFDFLVADDGLYYELECGGVLGAQDAWAYQDTGLSEWKVGSDNLEDEVAFSPSVGEWWTVKCEKTETTCKIKVWKRTLAEPGTWGLEETPPRTPPRAYDTYLEIDTGDYAGGLDNIKIWIAETSAILIPLVVGVPAGRLAVSPTIHASPERFGFDAIVTHDSKEVVCASGAFSAYDVNKIITLGVVVYRVASVTNSTTIQLERPYEGPS